MCIIFVDFHLSLAFWDYFLRLLKISLGKLRTKPRSRKSQMKSLCWGGLFLKYFPKSMLDPWTWLRIMNKESCKSLFLWSTTNMPVSAMSPFMWEIGDGKTINMISATRTNASGSFSILKAVRFLFLNIEVLKVGSIDASSWLGSTIAAQLLTSLIPPCQRNQSSLRTQLLWIQTINFSYQ